MVSNRFENWRRALGRLSCALRNRGGNAGDGRPSIAWLCAVLALGGVAWSQLPDPAAAGNTIFGGKIREINLQVDKTAGAAKLLPEKDRRLLAAVFEEPVIFLNLKVIVDGTDVNAVTTRVEESTVPEPVPCDSNNFGRLIMGPDIEYIVDSAYSFKGQTVHLSASIFPGARTEFPYNDVSCNYYAENTQATFEVTGFYYVHINPVKDGFQVQLRPISPEFSVANSIVNRSPLKKLQDRLNAQTAKATERARSRLEKFKRGVQEFLRKF